jgi:hypothetical protein
MSKVPRLVQKAQRVHIALGLNDAQMDAGQFIHDSTPISAGRGE